MTSSLIKLCSAPSIYIHLPVQKTTPALHTCTILHTTRRHMNQTRKSPGLYHYIYFIYMMDDLLLWCGQGDVRFIFSFLFFSLFCVSCLFDSLHIIISWLLFSGGLVCLEHFWWGLSCSAHFNISKLAPSVDSNTD